MADKLFIIMVNTDPANASELAPAFLQAIVAAAMEYEVEIVLSGRAGELAKQGVAAKLFAHAAGEKSVYDLMQEAHNAGVIIKLCTSAMENWGDDLIPEIAETVGGAYIISEAMNDDTVTFTY